MENNKIREWAVKEIDDNFIRLLRDYEANFSYSDGFCKGHFLGIISTFWLIDVITYEEYKFLYKAVELNTIGEGIE